MKINWLWEMKYNFGVLPWVNGDPALKTGWVYFVDATNLGYSISEAAWEERTSAVELLPLDCQACGRFLD